MIFRDFRADNFRNLKRVRVALSSQVNYFIGQNGQGKSNLLEALYLLAGFRSFRGARNRDLVGPIAGATQVAATIEVDGLERELKFALKEGSKSYVVDGKPPQSLGEWLGKMVLVTFSPDDLYLVKGEPELRRRWLDRIIFLLRPKHLGNVLAYQKALKARNTLLKDGMYGRDLMLLDSFDEMLARYGAEVSRERGQWSQAINVLVNGAMNRLTRGAHEIDLRYESEVQGFGWQEILNELVKRRNEDIGRRQTRWGAHHDDLLLDFAGKPARRFASQGEQRALTVALKLGETELLKRERNVEPVLLLDDVIGELDQERNGLLFTELSERRGQVFIAGTEIPEGAQARAQSAAVYEVKGGEIRQVN